MLRRGFRAACLALAAATTLCGASAEVFRTGLPVASEPVALTALVSMNANVGDWNTHPAAALLEERTGVHVAWTCVPDQNFIEKRDLLFAGDDLPDMMIRARLSATDEAKYAASGQLQPLDELMDYAPNLRAILEKHPDIRKNLTAADGHIYCFPQLRDTTDGFIASNDWINTAWLDALGLPMPTTTDELTQTLRAFVRDDPNGNGVRDELGFSGCGIDRVADVFDRFYGAFGIGTNNGVIDNYFDVDDEGKVRLAAATDGYRSMLEWLRALWAEGLIDQDTFSQNAGAVSAKANLGIVGFCSNGNNPQ